MILKSIALTLILAAPPQATPEGAVTGVVRGRYFEASRPLSHAMVEIVAGGRIFSSVADSTGSYVVTGVPAGPGYLRATHVGYTTLGVEIVVPEGGTVRLDLELDWKPIQLPPLTVLADPIQGSSAWGPPNRSELAELSLLALEGSPGMVEAGLAVAVRSLPGGDPSESSDVLYMRGSTADMKLVMLDGAPLYTPFHVGGLLEPFDPNVLGEASLYLGGAPARYDGGLSYILDLRTRYPRRDRFRASGSLDLLSASARVEGPLSSSSGFLLSSRALHEQDVVLPAGRGAPPYGYQDVLGRFDLSLAPEHTLFATAFWNRESVRLDVPSTLRAQASTDGSTFPGGVDIFGGDPGDLSDPFWENGALSLAYVGAVGKTGARVVASTSAYSARLPLSDSLLTFAEGSSRRSRVTADFSRPWGDGSVRYGASADRLSARYHAQDLSDSTAALVETRGGGTVLGAYLEGLHPVSERVHLRGGVRVDHFSDRTGFRLAPRFSLAWTLTEEALLTIAAGQYNQYARAPAEDVEAALGDPSFSSAESTVLPVARASHLVVSLNQRLTPGLRLDLEGFVKGFSGVEGVSGESLRASGVELRVRGAGERLSGWLGYSLQWYWAPGDGGPIDGSAFAGRHLLSAGLLGTVAERMDVDLRLSYGNGLPYTTIPIITPTTPGASEEQPTFSDTDRESASELLNEEPALSGGPLGDFLRVDAEISTSFAPRWWGRTWTLTPFLRVLNALNRRDALFYYFEPWRDASIRPLAETSVLPVLGLAWRF